MTRRIRAFAFGAAIALQTLTIAMAQPGREVAENVGLRHVITGLRKLRLELLEHRLLVQQSRIAEIERELRHLQAVQNRVEEMTRTGKDSIRELEVELARPELSLEARQELEARRAELLAGAAAPLDGESATLVERTADAHTRLDREKLLLQRLTTLGRQMASSSLTGGGDTLQ